MHVVASNWHNLPVRSYNWQVLNIYDSLTKWAVPIFIMVSGACNLRVFNKQELEQVTVKQEIKTISKKTLHLFCVIIFWSILYRLIFFLGRYFIKREIFDFYDILNIFSGIIFSPAWYHLWFLYMLIGIYLLIPIIRIFVTISKRGYIEYILVLFFLFGTFLPLCDSFLGLSPFFKNREIYFQIPELSGYIGYFIAGYYFANYELNKKIKVAICILAVLSMFSMIFGTAILSLYDGEYNRIFDENILATTMFVSYFIFSFFKEKLFNKQMPMKYKQIIINISKNTFGIYLIHPLVLEIFNVLGLNSLIMNSAISIPIISILIIFVSYICTIILGKIPILKNIL
jgi:surface polysaccharide O-acyltransferase-like enzyme